jgi:hypothetical protein
MRSRAGVGASVRRVIVIVCVCRRHIFFLSPKFFLGIKQRRENQGFKNPQSFSTAKNLPRAGQLVGSLLRAPPPEQPRSPQAKRGYKEENTPSVAGSGVLRPVLYVRALFARNVTTLHIPPPPPLS